MFLIKEVFPFSFSFRSKLEDADLKMYKSACLRSPPVSTISAWLTALRSPRLHWRNAKTTMSGKQISKVYGNGNDLGDHQIRLTSFKAYFVSLVACKTHAVKSARTQEKTLYLDLWVCFHRNFESLWRFEPNFMGRKKILWRGYSLKFQTQSSLMTSIIPDHVHT